MPLVFLPFPGSGFGPVEPMPAGLRWFAEDQPFSPITETLRALLAGTAPEHLWPALGWLATGHAQVRAVLADHRFSSRPELAHHPVPGLDAAMPPAPLGDLAGTDPPEHTRYRRLFTGWFAVRRTHALAGAAERATTEHLDAMAERGRAADLVRDYAKPVPAAIICDVLGVPHTDRAAFLEQVDLMASPDERPDARFAAYARVQEHLADLAGAKRVAPDDDLISALAGGGLRVDEVAGLATSLLGAGADTTAAVIGLSALALLRDRERVAPGGRAQFHALLKGEDPVKAAVEELLRPSRSRPPTAIPPGSPRPSRSTCTGASRPPTTWRSATAATSASASSSPAWSCGSRCPPCSGASRPCA
nr:hypothetical protein [Actinosynnema pretiosum]